MDPASIAAAVSTGAYTRFTQPTLTNTTAIFSQPQPQMSIPSTGLPGPKGLNPNALDFAPNNVQPGNFNTFSNVDVSIAWLVFSFFRF